MKMDCAASEGWARLNKVRQRRTCHLMNCSAPIPVVMQASFTASIHRSGLDHEPPILQCYTTQLCPGLYFIDWT